MATTPKFSQHSGNKLADPSEYRSIVGSFQYLAFTRPDNSYAVNRLSQYMHSPTDQHWQAAKRVLRYLKGTPTHVVFLKRHNPLSVHAYSDADWAGDVDDYVSTNAYVTYLGHNPVSWSSKKQTEVLRSSTEAEYRSGANTASELRWMKHIAIDYHFIRTMVQDGALRVVHVSTRDQLADLLTKPLSPTVQRT
ncbi:PREDICTED: uncharacterized protein LOC109130484 [Camelina sativa]|uniref:Uncharacterized protein LOC109130484 n=1 Tax=Camelina sativa TaxID=90675 RepID=A0ABM1R9C5_CAMSA|nr:PREDICTED: uncharacterized protein LOC109130484 [Camelina sativa]